MGELLADARAAVVQDLVDAADAGAVAGVLRRPGGRGGAPRPTPALRALVAELLRVLEGWRSADKALSGRAEMALLPALADMKAQLERLVHPGFVGEAGPEQLRRYPTYLARAGAAPRRARPGRRVGAATATAR